MRIKRVDIEGLTQDENRKTLIRKLHSDGTI